VASINDEIKDIIEDLKPGLTEAGFRLVEFGFANLEHSTSMVLRFLVDRANKKDVHDGITHGDCIVVTKMIEGELSKHPKLDQVDYTIEVSSPGITRAFENLEDYKANLGFEIVIRLKTRINEQNKFSGFLREVSETEPVTITLEVTGFGESASSGPKKKATGSKKIIKFPEPKIIVPLSDIAKANVKIQF